MFFCCFDYNEMESSLVHLNGYGMHLTFPVGVQGKGVCEKERCAWIHLSVLCCTWDGLPWDVCWAFLEEKKLNEHFLWDSEKSLKSYFLFMKLEIDLLHHIWCQLDAKEQLREWPAQWCLTYNIAFLMQFVFHFDTIHFPSTFRVKRHYSLFKHVLGWRHDNCSLVTSTMIKTSKQTFNI